MAERGGFATVPKAPSPRKGKPLGVKIPTKKALRLRRAWRREGDLNPRTGITRLLVFEASPFSLLGTSPYFNHSFIMLAQAEPFCKEFLI